MCPLGMHSQLPAAQCGLVSCCMLLCCIVSTIQGGSQKGVLAIIKTTHAVNGTEFQASSTASAHLSHSHCSDSPFCLGPHSGSPVICSSCNKQAINLTTILSITSLTITVLSVSPLAPVCCAWRWHARCTAHCCTCGSIGNGRL